MTVWLAGVAGAAAILLAAGGGSAPLQRLVALERWPPADRVAAASGSGGFAARRALTVALAAGSAVAAARVPVGVPVTALAATVVAARIRAARQAALLREAASRATVEVTGALAAELRAGRTPAQAITAVAAWSGPLQAALSRAAAGVAAGTPTADALLVAAAIPGAEPLRQVAAAWRVTEATGGRLAGVLDRLTDALDAERELQQELDSALAGPRATVVLLAGLPVLGLGLGQAVGAHPLQFLLHQPLGWGLLAAAAALDAVGVLVMSRITRWATRW